MFHKNNKILHLFLGRQKNEISPGSSSNATTDEYELDVTARINRAIRYYVAVYPDTNPHPDLDGLSQAGAFIRRYRLRAAQGGEDVVRDDLDYAGRNAENATARAVFICAFDRDGDYVDED